MPEAFKLLRTYTEALQLGIVIRVLDLIKEPNEQTVLVMW